MGIQEYAPRSGGGSSQVTEELGKDITGQAPEVDVTLSELDRALAETDRRAQAQTVAKPKVRRSSCCWLDDDDYDDED